MFFLEYRFFIVVSLVMPVVSINVHFILLEEDKVSLQKEILNISDATGVLSCARKCARETSCGHFNYLLETSTCSLLKAVEANQKYTILQDYAGSMVYKKDSEEIQPGIA